MLIFPLYLAIIDKFLTELLLFQGYEGSLLKVTSKNGKTASPVGFVTFASRASAEAAKQDLQVGRCCQTLPPPCHHCHHCLPPLAQAAAMVARVVMATRRSCCRQAPPSRDVRDNGKQPISSRISRASGQSEASRLLLWTLLLLRPNISCHCAFKIKLTWFFLNLFANINITPPTIRFEVT